MKKKVYHDLNNTFIFNRISKHQQSYPNPIRLPYSPIIISIHDYCQLSTAGRWPPVIAIGDG